MFDTNLEKKTFIVDEKDMTFFQLYILSALC